MIKEWYFTTLKRIEAERRLKRSEEMLVQLKDIMKECDFTQEVRKRLTNIVNDLEQQKSELIGELAAATHSQEQLRAEYNR